MPFIRVARTAMKGLVAGATVATSLALATAPANAATVSGWASGPVGVPQTISITNMSSGGTQDGQCNDASEPFVATINGVAQPQQSINVVNGTATITYIPASVGAATWTLGSGGIGGCDIVTGAAMSITQTPTVTVVSAPNTVTTGQPTVINVLVTAAGTSNVVPTGSVRLNTGLGVNITTMNLTPSFSGGTINAQAPAGAPRNSSFAFYRWTPPSNGTYTFQSVYSGDSNSLTSTSAIDTVLATPSGGTISLNAPNTATVGVPIALSASVFPANSQGSVGFTLNGQPISGSIPLVNGVANYTWTPTVAGNANLGASYTTNDGRSGSTQPQPIAIAAGPGQSDSITLIQPGFGPWSPNGVYTLANGTSFTFQASSLSGAPVALTETGPCNLNGATLTIDTGAGQCNLSATSPGGPGYAPVKVGYTITMVPGTQTATLAAPATGSRFQRGRTVRLETPAQGQTNAGQQIEWRVLKNSRNNCRLRFPANGAVTLQMQRSGQCNVRATAPGVPNSWDAFRLDLRYRVR
jgi:hypothetical protein